MLRREKPNDAGAVRYPSKKQATALLCERQLAPRNCVTAHRNGQCDLAIQAFALRRGRPSSRREAVGASA
jgi:hypothetical protein